MAGADYRSRCPRITGTTSDDPTFPPWRPSWRDCRTHRRSARGLLEAELCTCSACPPFRRHLPMDTDADRRQNESPVPGPPAHLPPYEYAPGRNPSPGGGGSCGPRNSIPNGNLAVHHNPSGRDLWQFAAVLCLAATITTEAGAVGPPSASVMVPNATAVPPDY